MSMACMLKPTAHNEEPREFSLPESMSPESLLNLSVSVQELERSGADPSLWVGFRYRGTDWSFMKRTHRPDAD